MLILLPPSETKKDGGSGAPLDIDRLGFCSLRDTRAGVVTELVGLASDQDASIRALKLSPRQTGEIERNRHVRTTPTMPALLRYTGVLYDALDAPGLTEGQWRFAASAVAVQSALLGLVRAEDAIPAYRLSFDSRLSPSLKKRWSGAVSAVLSAVPGLILDLRSEGYAALGPLPHRDDAHYVRVMARDEHGAVRALNHFNKQAKGLLTRALIEAGEDFETSGDLLDWAAGEGYEISRAADSRDLVLMVPEVSGSPGKLRAVLRAAAA